MKKNKHKKIDYIILVIAISVFIVVILKIIGIIGEYVEGKKIYKDLIVLDENSVGISSRDYKRLKAKNEEFEAWIIIPNTKINYPIAKGKDNSFYLSNTFTKEKNSVGSIFVDYRIERPFEDKNTILYGHYMKDGSMFADLNKYKKNEFALQNEYVYILLENKVLRYKIFSIINSEFSEEFYEVEFYSENEYLKYLEVLKSKSIIELKNIDLNDENIITLSTCSFNINEGRLIIYAKLEEIIN